MRAKIDKQAELKPCNLEIIGHLGSVFVREGFDRLKLNDDFPKHSKSGV
jgi:hypothetical protein